MNFNELKNKSIQELKQLVSDLKAELFTLNFKNSTGSLDQSHKIKLVRRDIARILTAIAQKELDSQKGAK
ncbi:50S ribosomal protein L29 [Mycoplasmopsis gallinarum]|uniref:Large ribosomal subunit protein uL29 n=1 Tax=Mycoplasmopsis gallinarum TaxID=29557 RepID=A0A168RND6_9BACT|nr:50S ribosomal protein L29 [Mycoplasmopsis gallinarum]OAB49141.1 LSU ribosomal protein L29p (L35e) [Mycoplasmopsis gallinarum]